MVKHFQNNFNLDAENFYEMLKRSLDKTSNLLAGSHYLPRSVLLNMFAKNEPETVRKMFNELFDEKIDIWERINKFKSESSKLLEKYGTPKEEHHQSERTISTYLWLRYPDKYYIYKFYDEICDKLKKETEIIEMFKSQLTKDCYPDPELKTLTQDVGFYIYTFK